MAFLRTKHGPWKQGHECMECGALFHPNVVCPKCGQTATAMDNTAGHKMVSIRDTWIQVPEWLNMTCFSMLWWGRHVEKKPVTEEKK